METQKRKLENGNWKVKTELETEKISQPLSCCNPSKIYVLLSFVSRHPRACFAHSQAFATFSISVLANIGGGNGWDQGYCTQVLIK